MKNKKHNFPFLVLMAVLPVLLAGCVSFTTSKTVGKIADSGGVFKSVNKGASWQNKSLMPTLSGKPDSFSALDVSSLAMDPEDSQAIYFGSFGNGLFYSYDGGENWEIAKSLGQTTIQAAAVDPGSKCVIYASSGNKVFKSADCSRTWEQIYFDSNPSVIVYSLAVDHFNDANVFIGLSRGDLLESFDYGASWQAVYRFPDDVLKIVISPKDSRVMYAVIANRGLYKSLDGGKSWNDFAKSLKDFKNAGQIKDIAVPASDKDVLFMATTYGLLRSYDQGETWEKVELITPDKESTINSMAVNPKNLDEIYYVTNTAFFRSSDGGVNWSVSNLPTSRAGWKILINPDDPNIIYMGVKSLKK